MLNLRHAGPQDIEQIRQMEMGYYGGIACPDETLKNWIQNLSENFIVAEENAGLVGFIFFEYLDEIKALPFVHESEHKKTGTVVYVSDMGIADEYQNSTGVLQKLFDKLVEKSRSDGCKIVVWVTGSKSTHDKIESKFLEKNGFAKRENVKRWEAYPGLLVDDHFIWTKEIAL